MWVFLALVGCTGDGIAVGVPWLVVPSELVFTDAEVGVPNVFGVPVENSGTAEAEVTPSVDPPFSVPVDVSFVPAGAAVELALVVTPADYTSIVGRISLDVGPDSHPVDITVTIDRDLDDDGHDALVAGGDDCDDTDPEGYPGAVETCDGVDQDCDDRVDNVLPEPSWWPDADLDGYGDALVAPIVGCDAPAGSVGNGSDCDDADPAKSPEAAEIWYDGMDQDCDGNDDDQDLDGAPVPADCNDLDPAVGPGALETWYDGVDQDCDGNDDDQDRDGDGIAVDCNDTDPAVGPSIPESDDGIDQDCDGLVDDGIWVRGTLVVTELMLFPHAVLDPVGRYFELYNPTDGDVVLADVTLTVGAAVVTLPAAPPLAPGGAAVVCSNDDPAVNGGITCVGGVSWSGNTRRVELAGGGVVLDEVGWASWVSPPGGVALELGLGLLDPEANDVEPSWCHATAVYGLGDHGTPGTITAPCQ